MLKIKRRVWKFVNGIDMDIIIPTWYLVQQMADMKWKAMEPIRPEFAGLVKEGDVIIAGFNFVCCSSRKQAPAVLHALGIMAIVAISFAGIIFRYAINLGIPAITCHDIYKQAEEGDILESDPPIGKILMERKGMKFTGSILPEFLLTIIESGGLNPHVAADAKMTVTHHAHPDRCIQPVRKGRTEW